MENVNFQEAKTALVAEISAVRNWREVKSNPQKEKINAPEEERQNAVAVQHLHDLQKYVDDLPVNDVLFRVVTSMDEIDRQELRYRLSTYGWDSSDLEPMAFIRDFVSFLLKRWTSKSTVISWEK